MYDEKRYREELKREKDLRDKGYQPACFNAEDWNLDDGWYCKFCGMAWYNCLCGHGED